MQEPQRNRTAAGTGGLHAAFSGLARLNRSIVSTASDPRGRDQSLRCAYVRDVRGPKGRGRGTRMQHLRELTRNPEKAGPLAAARDSIPTSCSLEEIRWRRSSCDRLRLRCDVAHCHRQYSSVRSDRETSGTVRQAVVLDGRHFRPCRAVGRPSAPVRSLTGPAPRLAGGQGRRAPMATPWPPFSVRRITRARSPRSPWRSRRRCLPRLRGWPAPSPRRWRCPSRSTGRPS
jgi:hypothetical protein